MGEHFDNLDSMEFYILKLNMLGTVATFNATSIVLNLCPNKRVVHFATHGSKKTQKKNYHRAIRIMEKTRHEN